LPHRGLRHKKQKCHFFGKRFWREGEIKNNSEESDYFLSVGFMRKVFKDREFKRKDLRHFASSQTNKVIFTGLFLAASIVRSQRKAVFFVPENRESVNGLFVAMRTKHFWLSCFSLIDEPS
jgi:hypothetical protein